MLLEKEIVGVLVGLLEENVQVAIVPGVATDGTNWHDVG